MGPKISWLIFLLKHCQAKYSQNALASWAWMISMNQLRRSVEIFGNILWDLLSLNIVSHKGMSIILIYSLIFKSVHCSKVLSAWPWKAEDLFLVFFNISGFPSLKFVLKVCQNKYAYIKRNKGEPIHGLFPPLPLFTILLLS